MNCTCKESPIACKIPIESLQHDCCCSVFGSKMCLSQKHDPDASDCPKCHTGCTTWDEPKDVAYCCDCDITFQPSSGILVDLHTAAFNPQTLLYECNHCKFQTKFLEEKLSHERTSPVVILSGTVKKEETKEEVKEELHYCEWSKEHGKFKCKYCDFTGWMQDVNKHETAAGRKANGVSPYSNYGSAPAVKHCEHPPYHLIDGKDWHVYIGRKEDCAPKLKDFDIFFNLTGIKVSKKHELPKSLQKYAGNIGNCTEYMIDWPDFGIPNFPREFWDDLVQYLIDNKLKFLISCVGGHGRTGTAAACLLISGCGMGAKEACQFVWDNYCSQAIETFGQKSYIFRMAGETPPEPPKEEKKETKALISYGGDYYGKPD